MVGILTQGDCSAPARARRHSVNSRITELLGQKFGGTTGLGQLGGGGVAEEVTLVTEPDRLIPHRLEMVRTVRVGDPTRPRQVDRTTWTFDWIPFPTKG
jgi:hypothetical protein